MTTYLDTSVVLRWVLGAPDALPRPVVVATHDRELARAAGAVGLDVLGARADAGRRPAP